MIEFRLHEGHTQYRTWDVLVLDETALIQYDYHEPGGPRTIKWTEWQDVPIAIKVVSDNDHG